MAHAELSAELHCNGPAGSQDQESSRRNFCGEKSGQHSTRSHRAWRHFHSMASLGLSGSLLVAAIWHFTVNKGEARARGGGNDLYHGKGESRARGGGNDVLLVRKGRDGGSYTWLDSFALGAGVSVKMPKDTVLHRNRPTSGSRDQHGSEASTVTGTEQIGRAAAPRELRAETSPPHHEGTWMFTSTGPSFNPARKLGPGPRGQMMDGVPLNIADKGAADATQGAIEWQQRVVQYYKRQMEAGRIKEMPPLPSASGHLGSPHAFYKGGRSDQEAQDESQQEIFDGDADAAAEVAVQEEEKKEAGDETKEGEHEQTEPDHEEVQPEHEYSWSFDPFSGPKPEKTKKEKYHNPSTYVDSGWDMIFGSPPPPVVASPSKPSAPRPASSHYRDARKERPKEDSSKVWMSLLCSLGVLSVVVVYVSMDYHVDDIDVP